MVVGLGISDEDFQQDDQRKGREEEGGKKEEQEEGVKEPITV